MAEKPAHVLEISNALGRDIDKAAEGKIAPPPIEAFLSDGALAEIERATKAKDEPVHAESLHPITRGQANAHMTFDGTSLPAAPAQRRVIPAPFRRPRIEAGSHGKTWQWVSSPDEVTEGDIVPDVGLVVSVTEHVVHKSKAEVLGLDPVPEGLDSYSEQVAVGTVILLTGQGGAVKAYRLSTPVRVFRKSV